MTGMSLGTFQNWVVIELGVIALVALLRFLMGVAKRG